MKINSDQLTDTLTGVVSSLINNSFEIAHKNATVSDVALATAQEVAGGISSAFDFSSGDEGDLELSDIKNGIYSIIYAGLASGFESIEETDDNRIAAVLSNTKEAALSKSKQVIPDYLCDKIHSQVSSSFASSRESINNKTYKSNIGKNATIFAHDSAELLANKGIENLHGVLSGDITASEALETSLKESASEIKDKTINNVLSKTIDKIGAKDYTSADEILTKAGEIIDGETTLTEAVKDKAINSAINEACDKIGISKYLEPTAVIDTAKNVKDCFIEYVNGEITYPHFFLKIGQDGLYQVAQAWGTSIGTSIVLSSGMQGIAAAVTAAAASTIVTAVYSELYTYALNVFEEEVASAQRLSEIRALSEEAISVIRAEREFLLNSTFIRAEKRQKVFNESLNSMAVALETGNVELLSEALNQITAEVGGTIQFKSFEEFDEFMLDDSLALEF